MNKIKPLRNGRPKGMLPETVKKCEMVYFYVVNREKGFREACRDLNLSTSTYYNWRDNIKKKVN